MKRVIVTMAMLVLCISLVGCGYNIQISITPTEPSEQEITHISGSAHESGDLGYQNDNNTPYRESFSGTYSNDYNSYNNKTVTGAAVKEAIKIYQGQKVAIFINTIAMDEGVPTYKEHEVSNVWYFENGVLKSVNEPIVKGGQPCGVALENSRDRYYINYNALLGGADNFGNITVLVAKYASMCYLQNNQYNSHFILFAKDANTMNVMFDNTIEGIAVPGCCEYFRDDAEFQAYLIQDQTRAIFGETGDIMGILFTQISA